MESVDAWGARRPYAIVELGNRLGFKEVRAMITEWANCTAPIIRLPIEGETEAVLMEDWHVEVYGFRFVVRAGARTDGASVPRWLWRVGGHPLETPRVYAAMLHDYLYGGPDPEDPQDDEALPSEVERAGADEIYYRLRRHFGEGWLVAASEYEAIRWFGASHWVEADDKRKENQ